MKLGWHSLGTSFDCSCGVTHRLPIEVCYLGDGAAGRLGEFARDRCGRRGLVVSDENTRRAGGEPVLAALDRAGKHLKEQVYGAGPLEATDGLGDELVQTADGSDFVVGVGSGTVCDLAKYAGDKLGLPALLFATAASMNGYTSSIVAMKVRGLKRTLPCVPALGVFADPAVVATAPVRMSAAGVGDFLSKNSSGSDWYAGHYLRGGYYCPRPGEFVESIQERVLACAPDVARAKPEAVGIVLEALMLAGFSMITAGSSAPASGGEHLISHFLDMKHALTGVPNDLHGAQVGVATVYTLELWEKVLAIDPGSLDVDAAAVAQPDDAEICAWIREDWGPVADEVIGQWREKALTRDGVRAELKRLCQGLPELRVRLERELLPSRTVARAIREAGGPVTADELAAPSEEYRRAQRHARFLRNRFTILDLAAEAGLA